MSQVKYPLYKPKELSDKINILRQVNLSYGGSFLSDNTIDMDLVIDILQLLASYVHFDGQKNVGFDDDLFLAVPSNIVQYAFHSRIDSEYRLLERCLRHSFDSKTNDLRKATLEIIQDQTTNKLGFSFRHCVSASMKNYMYETHTIATENDILMSKCTCKAGRSGNERVLCVHSLVPLFHLTLLLTGGYLAQHILI